MPRCVMDCQRWPNPAPETFLTFPSPRPKTFFTSPIPSPLTFGTAIHPSIDRCDAQVRPPEDEQVSRGLRVTTKVDVVPCTKRSRRGVCHGKRMVRGVGWNADLRTV